MRSIPSGTARFCFVLYSVITLGKQQVLAVGDSSGTLHILEVPWSLSHTSSNEVHVHMYACIDITIIVNILFAEIVLDSLAYAKIKCTKIYAHYTKFVAQNILDTKYS